MLENTITFFREESIKMANTIDTLKKTTKTLKSQLNYAESEVTAWHEEAKTLKFQNVILRNTISKLKSPKLIAKYEEHGRYLAE